MINFGISVSKQKDIEDKFIKYNIKDCDLVEKFIHKTLSIDYIQ